MGEKDKEAMVFDGAIEAGNKLIANVNKVYMFGKPRLNKMSRLLRPAEKGQTEIQVESGLDWVVGDRIGLLATAFNSLAADDGWITSYDNTTGLVSLNVTLDHYHWGQAASTADDFEGIDLRGEVVLLSRNVRIVGEDIESWGGQMVTSDTVEIDDSVIPPEIKMRQG